MSRPLAAIVGLCLILVVVALTAPRPKVDDFDPAICAGPPLRGAAARNAAMEAGYAIHPGFGCIEKSSFEAVNADHMASEAREAAKLRADRSAMAQAGAPEFAQARHGFQTRLATQDSDPLPLPQPPDNLFVRSDYKNPQNYTLPGFVSPDPRDGQRHPAILWLTGGDSNSLGDFWTPGSPENDQSARAFREAGIIMMFPSLRGGNGNRASREWLLGEVDDVLAAAEQLARLSFVDPDQIYLGGHSTGGTLALLTAAMKTPFKAVFVFGPVAEVHSYSPDLIPVDFDEYDPMEAKLRSPIHWLGDIHQPTYVFEGTQSPSNQSDFEHICAGRGSPMLTCIAVKDADHFSVLAKVTPVLASKIRLSAAADQPLSLNAQEF